MIERGLNPTSMPDATGKFHARTGESSFLRNNQLGALTSLRQQGDQLPPVAWGLKGSEDLGFPVLKLRKFWANWDKVTSLSGSDTESGITL